MIEFIQANSSWLVFGGLFLMMMWMHGGMGHGGHQHGADRQEPHPDKDGGTLSTLTQDPVCDMPVDPREAASVDYNGRSYYFCSAECKGVFEKHPDKFVQGQGAGHNHRMLGGG